MLVSTQPLNVSHNAVDLNPILQNLQAGRGFLPYQVDTCMHVFVPECRNGAEWWQ